jgi:hypothetical protein
VTGKVTAVSGSSITVSGTGFDGARRAGSNAPSAGAGSTAAPATKTYTVTVGSATKYTKTGTATSSALVVGQCATARGSSDDTGAITATTIAVSAPVDGGCTAGFGGFAGGPGGGFGSRGGGNANSGSSGSDA